MNKMIKFIVASVFSNIEGYLIGWDAYQIMMCAIIFSIFLTMKD